MVLFTNKLSECWCRIINCLQSFIHPTILVRELHNMHVHIVLCCGVKTVLFTNKLCCWCHIINPYLLTKFHTSKYLGKRVTQTCMFTLFFVVVRKGYCLPTSYQNVGVVSVFPTCFPSFMHLSILVRELCKLACPIVMYWPKLFIVVFQKVRFLPKL